MRKHLVALAAACIASAIALPASAGERTAVSALSVLKMPADETTPPPRLGVPGLRISTKEYPHAKYTEWTAAKAQGYCLIQRDQSFIGLSLNDSITGGDIEELWHLVETDGKATLERIRFEMALDNAWVKSKSKVELRPLATGAGLTAWGMKEANGTVLVLARGATNGRESMRDNKTEGGQTDFASSSCAFGATRLSAATIALGAVAQLQGTLPVEIAGETRVYPRFAIDISAVKVSRDPESMLSVRIRRLDP